MSTVERFLTALMLALLVMFIAGAACWILGLLAVYPTVTGVSAFIALICVGLVSLFMHALKD